LLFVNWNLRVRRDSNLWPVYRPVKGFGPQILFTS
jgi:hypothetical protein